MDKHNQNNEGTGKDQTNEPSSKGELSAIKGGLVSGEETPGVNSKYPTWDGEPDDLYRELDEGTDWDSLWNGLEKKLDKRDARKKYKKYGVILLLLLLLIAPLVWYYLHQGAVHDMINKIHVPNNNFTAANKTTAPTEVNPGLLNPQSKSSPQTVQTALIKPKEIPVTGLTGAGNKITGKPPRYLTTVSGNNKKTTRKNRGTFASHITNAGIGVIDDKSDDEPALVSQVPGDPVIIADPAENSGSMEYVTGDINNLPMDDPDSMKQRIQGMPSPKRVDMTAGRSPGKANDPAVYKNSRSFQFSPLVNVQNYKSYVAPSFSMGAGYKITGSRYGQQFKVSAEILYLLAKVPAPPASLTPGAASKLKAFMNTLVTVGYERSLVTDRKVKFPLSFSLGIPVQTKVGYFEKGTLRWGVGKVNFSRIKTSVEPLLYTGEGFSTVNPGVRVVQGF